MVYVDPVQAGGASIERDGRGPRRERANLILPAGDVRIGPLDYNIYTNSQLSNIDDINRLPLKTVGNRRCMVADVGEAQDA